MIIAIIPARAGSKRLPNKNVKSFSGKPLIDWTVTAAIEANIFDQIIISTNDQTIANMYAKNKAIKIFWRPENIATDTTPMVDVIDDILFRTNEQNDFCVLQPTAPLRSTKHIIEANSLFKKTNKSLVSVRRVEHPVDWSFQLDLSAEIPADFVSNLQNKRSQDFKQYYQLNGAMYFYKIVDYLNYKTQIIPHSKIYEMSYTESIDIDTEQDFILAELIHNEVFNNL